ncbi:MAG: hypothetical protein BWK76_11135 [Desulfobulbaceae bacterium A2]|nr:MAG: hypothetical protein BWK76_11135 [Desulfobulbaceae bacterium A2]
MQAPNRFSHFLFYSIKGRIVLGILAILSLLTGLLAADMMARQRGFMRDQLAGEGVALAVALAANAPSWVISGDLAALDELVDSLKSARNLTLAAILDPGGRVRATSDPALFNLVLDDDVSRELLANLADQVSTVPCQLWHHDKVDTMVAILGGGQRVGYVRVVLDSRPVSEELRRLLVEGLYYLVLALFVGGAIVWLLVHGMVWRLERLSLAADAIAAGDLTVSLDQVRGRDEVGRLARDFEQMVVCLREDRQARDQAETALFAEKERALVTLHSIGDGVITTDTRGVVEYLNPVAEALSGWTNVDASGRPLKIVFDIINEHSRLPVENPVEKAIANNRVVGLANHTTLRARDGRELCIEDSAAPIRDRQGAIIGAVLVFHDVSGRRSLEVERERMALRLQRAEKMEALGMMAGGVAHDLNNILSGIVAYPELLQLDLPPESPVRQGLEVIRQAGQRMGDVVEDLLTVARGAARTLEPLSLNRVVQGYLASPECSKITESSPLVRLETCLATDLPLVSGSRIHLGKVLMNLVQNAVEALAGVGRVEIGTRREGDARVLLWVADSGSGIPQEDLPHIFEPFYSKKKLGRSGTGLGLAIVWNVVREHDGEISVTSGESGTRFDILYPALTEMDEVVGAAAVETLPRGSGQRILVVDDEASQRGLAVALLQRLGYEAAAVSSGEAALTLLRRETWDLLLLDMLMEPGMNGRETFEAARLLSPGQRAVICSGFAASTERDQALAMGVSYWMKKPFSLGQLAEVVRAALAHSRSAESDNGPPPA